MTFGMQEDKAQMDLAKDILAKLVALAEKRKAYPEVSLCLAEPCSIRKALTASPYCGVVLRLPRKQRVSWPLLPSSQARMAGECRIAQKSNS